MEVFPFQLFLHMFRLLEDLSRGSYHTMHVVGAIKQTLLSFVLQFLMISNRQFFNAKCFCIDHAFCYLLGLGRCVLLHTYIATMHNYYTNAS